MLEGVKPLRQDRQLTSAKNILSQYAKQWQGKKKQRKLQPFQVWALGFAEKFGCKKSIGLLMRWGKKYQNNLDYLRYIEGWLADYPVKTNNIIPLFLWKMKHDQKSVSCKSQ